MAGPLGSRWKVGWQQLELARVAGLPCCGQVYQRGWVDVLCSSAGLKCCAGRVRGANSHSSGGCGELNKG